MTSAEPTRDSAAERTASLGSSSHMTCIFSSGVLGVAAFDTDTEEIKAFQGWEEDRGPTAFQSLRLALIHFAPIVVSIASNAPQELIEVLKDAEAIPGISPPELHYERSGAFRVDQALALLKQLRLSEMPETTREDDRMHWIHARLNLSATQQIRAVGALLQILQREEADLTIQNISEMKLDGCLVMDAATLSGLQIFQEDVHPSIVGIGRSKEGFSIFGMMDRCFTPSGRRMLRSWFLRPLINLDVIQERLDTIEALVQRSDILEALRSRLKHIKDVPSILRGLQCHQAPNKIQLLRLLMNSIDAMLHVAHLVQDLGNGSVYQYSGESLQWSMVWSDLLIAKKFENHITEELRECGQLIDRVIDISQDDQTMYIAPEICPELDRQKAIYSDLPEILTEAVEKELRRIPRCLSRGLSHHIWSIVYVPQVGYLTQIVGSPLGAEILEVLPDYEQAFESTAEDGSPVSYYTCHCTDALNDRYGDLLHTIQDMESALCAELVCRLLEYKPLLMRSICICAELDCLTSLALCAYEGRYCRPTVTESLDIQIQQGRHPLTEAIVDVFIPNDTNLTATQGCIQVVTGPNASGKSCYMKQVALIVFLSHIGSYVPAQSCCVGLTDQIFSRICTSQEARTSRIGQSTFMVDLSQMHAMVHQATPRSLLLIDEFGKVHSDGVLSYAQVESIGDIDIRWGRTALSDVGALGIELFSTGLTQRCPRIQYCTMDVLTSPSEDPRQHTLLYKLIPGQAAASYGIYCARQCGVPAEVVSRAEEIVTLRKSGQPLNRYASPRISAAHTICTRLAEVLREADPESSSSLKTAMDTILSLIKQL